MSKLGRFVGATFELRLRNIDKDSSWGRCQPIFIQEIGPTYYNKQKIGTTYWLYKKKKSRYYYLLLTKSRADFFVYSITQYYFETMFIFQLFKKSDQFFIIIILLYRLNKKSDRFFCLSNNTILFWNNVYFSIIQKSGRFYHNQKSNRFLFIQKIGPIFFINSFSSTD